MYEMAASAIESSHPKSSPPPVAPKAAKAQALPVQTLTYGRQKTPTTTLSAIEAAPDAPKISPKKRQVKRMASRSIAKANAEDADVASFEI
jgi:hypothetical protein